MCVYIPLCIYFASRALRQDKAIVTNNQLGTQSRAAYEREDLTAERLAGS
jgi:hypothetical protein